MKLRKGDTVKVITGSDKGKTGRVLEVQNDKNRVLVEGVRMVKRHTKANPAKQIKGGIAEKESPIHVSNVMIVTGNGKASRIGYKIEGEGEGDGARKVRVARKTGETLAGKK
ncbi:MAG: 50S ribosomal protein L24 [Acidobacteria bacterium]|nr:50S ribosomal protein L24 [Acidobacteriota bacterium]